MPTGSITSISICEACYHDEKRRFAERGAQVRRGGRRGGARLATTTRRAGSQRGARRRV